MNCLTNHLKLIAYFFAISIVLQSCVIYNSSSSSINEASEYNNGRIKIKTTEGTEYIFRWIEEKDGNIVSIKNTEKTFLKAERILEAKTAGPDPITISFDSLFTYKGAMVITAKDDKDKLQNYNFYKIETQNNLVHGFTKLAGDTTTVLIPKDQIRIN